MAEQLVLSTPETFPANATWRVLDFSINTDVVSDTVTLAQVKNAISFINAGTFKTQGKTLQKWLLEQIAILDNKAGTVTGTPD